MLKNVIKDKWDSLKYSYSNFVFDVKLEYSLHKNKFKVLAGFMVGMFFGIFMSEQDHERKENELKKNKSNQDSVLCVFQKQIQDMHIKNCFTVLGTYRHGASDETKFLPNTFRRKL